MRWLAASLPWLCVACGGSSVSFNGSCDLESIHVTAECIEYWQFSAADLADEAGGCMNSPGWSDSKFCNHVGIVGSCRVAGKGTAYSIEWYYPPQNASAIQSACESRGGTFTPGT